MDKQGGGVLQNFVQGPVDPRRCGNGGVSQGVVIDIFRAHNGGPLPTVFKQLPDAGAVGTQGIGRWIDHSVSPSMRYRRFPFSNVMVWTSSGEIFQTSARASAMR